jgi:hypothetical protein
VVPAVNVGDLLARRGVVVPERTLHRYCAEPCRDQAASTTVRLADPEPGREAQTDFGRMGLIYDPASSRRRVVPTDAAPGRCSPGDSFVRLSGKPVSMGPSNPSP